MTTRVGVVVAGGAIVATGRVALGVLCIVLGIGLVLETSVLARLDDGASPGSLARFWIVRQLAYGAWIVALGVVIFAEGRSFDWVVVLPIGVLYVCAAVAIWLAVTRRGERPR